MNELERIVGVLAEAARCGERALLATVVRSEGSTYRKAGARMAVSEGREVIGAISGGCLEADILARWNRLMASGAAERVSYDTRSRDDLLWGLGLGCNGRVDVLLEPLAGAALDSVHACIARALAADAGALATVVATDSPATIALGNRFLVDGDGAPVASASTMFDLGPDARAMLRDGWSVMLTGRSRRRTRRVAGATIEIF